MKKAIVFILLVSSSFVYSQKCDSLYLESLRAFDKELYKESIALVNQCIQVCPARVDYHLHAAKGYYQLKHYELTLSHVNQAIKIDETSIPAYALKAQMLMAAELYEQAIVNYEKILQLMPQVDTSTILYRVNLSKSYMNRNQYDKAYIVLHEIYHLDSTNLELLTNLSVCCMQIDKQQEAEYLLQRILSINPKFSAGLINMGFYLISKKEYQKAIEYFNMALIIQPREAYALNNRGYAYYMLGNTDNALNDINLSISYDPSNSYAYRNRALVYYKTGLLIEACNDLQKALDLGFTAMYGNEVLVLQKEVCPQKK